jgi:hypothetical protein
VLNVLLEKILITDIIYHNLSTVNTDAICNVSLCNLWRYEYFRGTCVSMFRLGYFVTMVQKPPIGPRSLHYRGFMIALRHTTLGRIPLDE